jgi:thiamine-phosphate pyrophosphorylase
MRDQFFKLMLVTDKKDKPLGEYLKFIIACVESGVTSVQLREKKISYKALLEFGKALQAILKPRSIPLIVNDSIKVACQLDADGVHLGQSDGSVLKARQKLGENKIIGVTVDAFEQINIVNILPVNYIGVSSVFPTKNKKNIRTIWGCGGLAKIVKLSNFPMIAIGGINEANISEVIEAGAHGIAAIGAFHDARNPSNVIKNLCKQIMV